MTSLVPTYTLGALTLTDYPYSVVFGSDLGQPTLEDEPREMTVTVGIEGADLLELAENEAALRREINKPLNEFGHNPGDGFAPTSVFDTTLITATPIRYEDGGEQTCYREWELSIEAEPHARSATLVTSEPLSVSGTPTTTTIDTCDSATGWTGVVNGATVTPSTTWSAGALSVFELVDPAPQTLSLTRNGAVTFAASGDYLVAEIGYNSALGTLPVSCDADGSRSLPILSQTMLSPGWFRYTYDASGGNVSSLTFSSYTSANYADLKIRNLARVNTPPGVTSRQVTRILPVSGTERSSASVHVVSPNGSDNLDLTIVHTSPEDGSGYSPPLRRWRTVGNTVTPDATRFSGASEPLYPNFFEAEVPVPSLPRGGYAVAACMSMSTAGVAKIQRSTSTVFADGSADGHTSTMVSFDFAAANTWYFVPLGILSLPSVRANAGSVRVTLFDPFAFGVSIDEAWLFRIDDDCALSILDFTPHPNLWLDSPDLTSPVPTVWVGDGADREDARHPASGLISMGSHVLTPPATAAFVATGDTEWPEVSASYYPRWHTHVAE